VAHDLTIGPVSGSIAPSEASRRAAPWPLPASIAGSPDVLERMASGRTKAHELEQLLPWNWQAERVGTEPKVTA
jgi:hypothetical protein